MSEPYAWKLTRDELAATEAKIAKINANAAKKGLSGLLTVESKEVTVTREIAGIPVSQIFFETVVTGEPPKHNGWVFLASLDWVETGVITRNAPGNDVNVDRAALRPGFCDHCGYNRKRKQTYVVLNEKTGQQVQVGSSCIKDFLGWTGTVVFLTKEEISEEVGSCSGWGTPEFTTESILAVAWACVKTFGYFRSREDGSTASTVWEVMVARENKRNRALKEKIEAVAKEAIPMAQKLREFVLSAAFAGDNDYVLNLKTYCRAEFNNSKSFGFLASVPQAYGRHHEIKLKRERENADRKNEWIGTLKKRQTFKVKVKAIKWLEDIYSYNGDSKPLYTLITDTGHELKWFASNDKVLGEDITPEDQDFFALIGTVVKHDEYNGYKSTVINRCKLA